MGYEISEILKDIYKKDYEQLKYDLTYFIRFRAKEEGIGYK
jgi:hypothetical protein